MADTNKDGTVSALAWWESKRRRYNVGLVIAGLSAFACYAAVTAIFSTAVSEVTIFTTFVQGIGYLFMMLLANICYFLGPLAERVVQAKDVNRFRRLAFRLGFWFSFALPFAFPLEALFSVEILTFLRSGGFH